MKFFFKKPEVLIETERLTLRLPVQNDFGNWVQLRRKSESFLLPWEPKQTVGFYSRSAFKVRVSWGKKNFSLKKAMPIFIFKKDDSALIGAVTLDNIRYGAIESASLGYWIGKPFSKRGYMKEALRAIIYYSSEHLKIGRIEAATLPENLPSRNLLEKSGFNFEGIVESYLKINGSWRDHVLYASLNFDRRSNINVE